MCCPFAACAADVCRMICVKDGRRWQRLHECSLLKHFCKVTWRCLATAWVHAGTAGVSPSIAAASWARPAASVQQGSFEQFCGKAPAFHVGTKLLLRPPKPPAPPKPGSASSRPAGKPLKLFYTCLRSFFAARYGMLAGRFHLCLLLCLNGVIGRAV